MAEKKVDPGLAAGIFVLPQVFGWLVLREGYGIATRFVVFTYMILSSIPLYFLVVTLWTSGGDLVSMAQDYDRNRDATERSIVDAKEYMDDYQSGDLHRADGGKAARPAAQAAGEVATTSVALARAAEEGAGALGRLSGKRIRISGPATAAPVDGKVYLAGTDLYPAVTLRMADPSFQAESGDEVVATCESASMGTAGPELANCR